MLLFPFLLAFARSFISLFYHYSQKPQLLLLCVFALYILLHAVLQHENVCANIVYMNGGDTDTGGAQVNPSNTPPSNPDSRPMEPVDSSMRDASLLSISHDQLNPDINQQPISQPGVQVGAPVTPEAVTGPIVSSPVPDATTSSTVVPHSAINANPQPQPADQLIAQTFASGGLPNQPGTVAPPYQPQQSTAQFFAQAVVPDNSSASAVAHQRKKSKKPLIVTLILIFTLVVVGGLLIAYMVINNMDNNSAKNPFEEFIIYLTGEDDANKAMTNFIEDNYYAIDKYFDQQGTEESKNYFNQLHQQWEKYVNSNRDEDDEKDLITEIDGDLGVVYLYTEKNIIPAEEVLKRYQQDGEDGAIAYFSEYFALENRISEKETQYIMYQDNYLSSVIKMIKIYQNNGCITGNNIDERCIEMKGLYNSQDYRYMMQAVSAIRNYAVDSKNQVKIACEKLIKVRMDKSDQNKE